MFAFSNKFYALSLSGIEIINRKISEGKGESFQFRFRVRMFGVVVTENYYIVSQKLLPAPSTHPDFLLV